MRVRKGSAPAMNTIAESLAEDCLMPTVNTPAEVREIDICTMQTQLAIIPGTAPKDLLDDAEQLLSAVATLVVDATLEMNSANRMDDRLFAVGLLTRLAAGMVSEARRSLASIVVEADRILAPKNRRSAP